MDADQIPPSLVLHLRELHNAMESANLAVARRMGMSITDATAIEHIALTADPIGPAELSRRLGVSRSSATEIVDRLVSVGHLERQRDAADGRRVRLVATTAAQRQVREEIAPLMDAIGRVTERLEPANRALIASFLSEMALTHLDFANGFLRSSTTDEA